MKRAALLFCAVTLSLLLASCGGSSNSAKPATTSKLTNRVFVSNTFSGVLQIVDATKDALSTFSVQMGGTPTQMYVSQDLSTVMGFDSRNNTIDVVDTATEARLASIPISGFTESFVSTKDGKTGYVAVRNGSTATQGPGLIQVLSLRDQNVATISIFLQNVRWLAANHAVTKLLAFSDNSDVVSLVDVTAPLAATPVPQPGTYSRPVAAYFSDDDTKAYILSCGAECGGSGPASITELVLATATIPASATRSVVVDAARVGTLQGTTLWVTGSPNGAGGIIQKVDVGAMTASPSVPIGPGTHTLIQSIGNKLWIGAENCGSLGCLSIFDPGSGTVKIDTQSAGLTRGVVTSITAVPHRDVVYVVEGGELRIYTIATGDLAPTQVDIVGAAFAAVSVSP